MSATPAAATLVPEVDHVSEESIKETSKPVPTYRQIRAQYDDETITVYQAYNKTIATAAVQHQKLSASPTFKPFRMTWIKPSWTWMMYRSGYSYKDANQSNILAIRMKHAHFLELLREAQLAEHGSSRTTGAGVIVQWDPERSVHNGRLEYRSIQIGISRTVSEKWDSQWIDSIEDVTEQARLLKKRLDEYQNPSSAEATSNQDQDQIHSPKKIKKQKVLTRSVLEEEGLIPVERPYEVPEDIMRNLRMMSDQSDHNNTTEEDQIESGEKGKGRAKKVAKGKKRDAKRKMQTKIEDETMPISDPERG